MLLAFVLQGSNLDSLSSSVATFFHLVFLGEFLQERNTSHAGYRVLGVRGCGVLAREKSSWKTGLRSELKVLQGKMGPNPRLPHSVQEPEPPATKE